MLYIGAAGLTLSAAVQLVMAAVVLVVVVVLGKPAPILYVVLPQEDVGRLDPQVIAASRALAVYFNSSLAALAVLKLCVIWTSLVRGQAWAFWALLGAVAITQTSAFLADAAIGHRTLVANVVLSALQATMLGLAAWGLFGRPA